MTQIEQQLMQSLEQSLSLQKKQNELQSQQSAELIERLNGLATTLLDEQIQRETLAKQVLILSNQVQTLGSQSNRLEKLLIDLIQKVSAKK